jgi:hypothetical protein
LRVANDVTGVEKLGSCAAGKQTYRIAATITVTNKTRRAAAISATDFDVRYRTASGRYTQHAVQVVSGGGFASGQSIPVGDTESYAAVVRAAIPCNGVNWARLIAELKVSGRDKWFAGGDAFVSSATSIPAAGIGGVALAFMLGAGLLAMQLRGRRVHA